MSGQVQIASKNINSQKTKKSELSQAESQKPKLKAFRAEDSCTSNRAQGVRRLGKLSHKYEA